MGTVSIHAPKTPITKGSSGIAAATVPNVCKMPGPPAPFVPTPLPNIGKSGMSPDGYSTSVTIDGDPVAIQGSSFGSMGDVASKGTGGGIVSNNCEGPTKFIAPGSLTVKIEGKNVQLLGDSTSNNNGPSGSPPNAACMMGTVQSPGTPGVGKKLELDCGEFGTYGDQKKKTGKGKYDRDHIPSKAALKEAAKKIAKKLTGVAKISSGQAAAIENAALSIVIPKSAHQSISPTYGGRNADLMESDAKDLSGAAKRDTAKMKKGLKKHADEDCVEAYNEGAKEINKMTNADYKKFLTNILKTVK
jgi:uncharacterized Zn-binding protein involved in type VI secretion